MKQKIGSSRGSWKRAGVVLLATGGVLVASAGPALASRETFVLSDQVPASVSAWSDVEHVVQPMLNEKTTVDGNNVPLKFDFTVDAQGGWTEVKTVEICLYLQGEGDPDCNSPLAPGTAALGRNTVPIVWTNQDTLDPTDATKTIRSPGTITAPAGWAWLSESGHDAEAGGVAAMSIEALPSAVMRMALHDTAKKWQAKVIVQKVDQVLDGKTYAGIKNADENQPWGGALAAAADPNAAKFALDVLHFSNIEKTGAKARQDTAFGTLNPAGIANGTNSRIESDTSQTVGNVITNGLSNVDMGISSFTHFTVATDGTKSLTGTLSNDENGSGAAPGENQFGFDCAPTTVAAPNFVPSAAVGIPTTGDAVVVGQVTPMGTELAGVDDILAKCRVTVGTLSTNSPPSLGDYSAILSLTTQG